MNGFAKVGALLMLVVPLDTPGLETLAAATGGVVLVGVPQGRPQPFGVLATIAAPPPLERPQRPLELDSVKRPRDRSRPLKIAALVVIALLIAGWLLKSRILAAYHSARARAAPAAALDAPPQQSAAMPPPADTVRLIDPVNPADSSSTSPFAVEMMAANTLSGANSFLSDNGETPSLSGATVSPVAVGGSASVWYKVFVGASHDHAGADSLLAALRRDGLVRNGQGRVVKVPYALVLADHVERKANAARSLTDSWQRRRDSTHISWCKPMEAFACSRGAFETPAQAAPLAASLRAAGVAPVLAFRTGRTY